MALTVVVPEDSFPSELEGLKVTLPFALSGELGWSGPGFVSQFYITPQNTGKLL